MKKIIVSIIALVVVFGFSAYSVSGNSRVSGDCTFNGKKLYGKVQVVTSFPDVTVQVVDSFPDLKVKVVTSFPDSCGEWQFVTSFPDLKIQYVTSFPNIKIKMVTSFPGLN